MSATKRVTALLRPAAIDALARLGADWDTGASDTIHRALAIAAVIEELRSGEPLKVVRPDGSIETVRFL